MGCRLKISLGLTLLAVGFFGLVWTAPRPHPPRPADVQDLPVVRQAEEAVAGSGGHYMPPTEMRQMVVHCVRAMEECRSMHEQMQQMMDGMMPEGMLQAPRPMPGGMMGPDVPMRRGVAP